MRTTAILVLGAALLAGCGKSPGGSGDWKDHKGDIAFLIGQDAGMRAAVAGRRPPMYFFTATW